MARAPVDGGDINERPVPIGVALSVGTATRRTEPDDAGLALTAIQATQNDGVAARMAGAAQENGYGHLAPRLAEFAATAPDDPRRRALRDELAAAFWPVVVHIARRYRDRGEPLSDLQQIGAVGLLGALQRFDPDRGDDFLSFAVPTITGEIRRHFRDRTWAMRIPRPLKDLQGPIRDAVDTLSVSLGRSPKPSEIAIHLDTTVEQVVDALGARAAYTTNSLDALANRTDDAGGLALGDLLGAADDALATAECRHELRQGLADLPERERTIIALRFFGDLTQTQIAAEVGLSQVQISRLLSTTLATLRGRIDIQP